MMTMVTTSQLLPCVDTVPSLLHVLFRFYNRSSAVRIILILTLQGGN